MSKMKKIEELGISPAPWELWNVSGVFNKLVNLRDNYEVAKAQDGSEVHFCSLLKDKAANLANARLIAAAPELYDAGQKTEAVLTGLFKLDEFAALLKSGAADALIACRDELRKALAKASGEGYVK